MNILLKIKIFLITFILFLSTEISYANIFDDKNERLKSSKYMTNYLYGTILNKRNDFLNSQKYLSGIEELKNKHQLFNLQYVIALTINGDVNKAYKHILDLNPKLKSRFPYNLIIFTKLIKSKKYAEAQKIISLYNNIDPLYDELIFSLKRWTILKSDIQNKLSHKSNSIQIDLINNFLISNYLGNQNDKSFYEAEILKNKSLHRYHAILAMQKIKKGKYSIGKTILQNSFKDNNNSIFLKQLIVNLDLKQKNKFLYYFNGKEFEDNLAEVLYLFSGFYFDRNETQVSQLLLALSNYLNPHFASNYLLAFEQDIKNNKDKINFKVFNQIQNVGSEYKWYINYQLVLNDLIEIGELEKVLNKKTNFLFSKYFDIANFYRYKKNYKKAIKYYLMAENLDKNKILSWDFYYYKGICYERLDNWNLAEKNFLKSLKISSKQYRVINYLAYSWLERKKNIPRAKKMLKQANELSNWKLGYIIDSLGWAYFLTNDYIEAERLLKLAYEKSPYEAEIYDHYGDVLWRLDKKLQARYVWKNALKLETIDDKIRKKIEYKITNGL